MRLLAWALSLLLAASAVATGAATPAPPPPAVSWVKVEPGVTLRVVQAGPTNDRTPIVFVPGWSFGADAWRGQMERFGKDRRVISLDPRSQGLSTVTTSGNTPEQRAADLHAVIASLNLSRPPVIVAWSQGVQDMAAYAERYGSDGLAGIVLVDAAVSQGYAGIGAAPAEAMGRFRLLDVYLSHQPEYLRGMLEAIIATPQPDGAIDALLATGMKTPPSIGAAMLVSDLYGPDRTGALDKMRCPVLIIASATSPELEAQRAMASRVARGRIEVVEGAAHAVFLDQPVRFGDALQRFVEGAN